MKLNYRMFVLTLIVSIVFVNFSTAQSTNREVGLKMRNFQSFDLLTKKQLKENKYLRMRFILPQIGIFLSEFNDQVNLAGGLSVGVEKRKAIGEKFQLLHGPEFGLVLSYNDIGVTSSFAFNPFIGYVIGAQYELSPRFSIGVEATPVIGATLFPFNDADDDGSLVLSINPSITVNVMYRFTK